MTNSLKHENFKRMADVRAKKLAKSYQVLSNLASYNYEFYADEIDKLFNYLEEHMAKARAKFDARLEKASSRANRTAAKTLGVPTGQWAVGLEDETDPDAEIDDERYPIIAEGGDLGEDATPCSPQTSLPGPSEGDIEHDNPHAPPFEAPWSNDEPAGPEMALADGEPARTRKR